MQVGQAGHLLARQKKHQEVSADNCSHPLRISLAIVKNYNPQNYEKPYKRIVLIGNYYIIGKCSCTGNTRVCIGQHKR